MKTFINLPVENLDETVAFFTKLGFKFNPQFTDKNATCMIISEDSYYMLLVRDYFQTFTDKPVGHAKTAVLTINAISLDSKEEVNKMVDAAVEAGANEYKEATDMGFMYTRRFEDLNGHMWEMFWMDPKAIEGN